MDRFSQAKLREGDLGPASINKLLTRLGQILERAVEYELIARNPAKVDKRKLKVPRYERGWVQVLFAFLLAVPFQ